MLLFSWLYKKVRVRGIILHGNSTEGKREKEKKTKQNIIFPHDKLEAHVKVHRSKLFSEAEINLACKMCFLEMILKRVML